jgi:hypothetical protein
VISPKDDRTADLIRLLLARLERVAVDSHWAHRASGIRGGLLRSLERIEAGQSLENRQLGDLVRQGFEILENAAREKTGARQVKGSGE